MYNILDFKAGDSVKWFEDRYAIIPLYGTIINIKGSIARIKSSGDVYRVELKNLNFD